MIRARRAVVVFLLTLTVALPVAALPASERAQPWPGLLANLWARLAPVLGLAEKSRPGADPNGLTAPTPPVEDSSAAPAQDGDSRAGADPDG
jgi:hypothetical protein